jgi:3-oxoacyl-[acyl-carrier-protein] synthase-3
MGIRGTGASLPERILSNEELSQFVDTSDSWIFQRSGIRTRHVIGPQESSLSLAKAASQEALLRANISPSQLDLIIVGTETSDQMLPATAARLQAALDCRRSNLAFDLRAACSGFLFGLVTADALMARCGYKHALVVGVDVISRILDWKDRSSCVLFGDGAGAVVISAEQEGNPWLLASYVQTDGNGAQLIRIDHSGMPVSTMPVSTMPISVGPAPFGPVSNVAAVSDRPQEEEKDRYVRVVGREVFKFAVAAMSSSIDHVLKEAGITAEQVDLFVPHQANLRIIEAVAEKIGITDPDRMAINIESVGNTSAASIPMALHAAVVAGNLFPGARVLFATAGAGLTYGAALIKW